MYNYILNLLKTAKTYDDIDNAREKIVKCFPTVEIMFGYYQQNIYHPYNLWEHCVQTVLNLPKNINDDMAYLAALFHDIGKPYCQCDGKNNADTNKHYYGHPQKSFEIVRDEIIPYIEKHNYNFSSKEKERLLYYVKFHDDRVSSNPKHLKRHLSLASFEEFQKLMLLQIADAKAHAIFPVIEKRIQICSQWVGDYGKEVYKEILENSHT